MLEQLKNFRSLYREMRDALPFLDCYVSDQSPAWDDLAKELELSHAVLQEHEAVPLPLLLFPLQ